jgi:hypothetical protein
MRLYSKELTVPTIRGTSFDYNPYAAGAPQGRKNKSYSVGGHILTQVPKVCAYCGRSYMGAKHSKYCGDPCRNAVANRITRERRLREKKAERINYEQN